MTKIGLKAFFKERVTLLISVLFPTYMFVLHAPFEIFLTNRENFWFGLKDFWWMIVVAFLAVFLILFVIGAFLPSKLRDIYSALGISGGLALYLQGNFLNLNLGTLNGSEVIWSDYKSKFIINLLIWGAIILIALALYFILKKKALKVLTLVASFVLIMQVVTLSTLFIGNIDKENENISSGDFSITDKDLYTVSSDKNVIFFVLDMFDNEYMNKIISDTPEIKEKFKDFTFFDNATGSYSTTCYSIGSLLTGQTVNNTGADFNQSVDISYENTKMYDELEKNGYLFDIYVADGYVPLKLREKAENYEAIKSCVSDNKTLFKRIYQLVTCKFAPDVLKPYLWMDGTEFIELKALDNSQSKAYTDNNLSFYNGLKNNGISTSDDKRFKFIHIVGTHYPYEINSKVEAIPSTSSPEQAIDTAMGVLKIVETYIEELKKVGAYENSTIVLSADHGYYMNGVLTNPTIMIKEANSSHDFAVSKAPVSHYDLHATIMDSLNLNANQKYGKSMFDIAENEKRERIFYQYHLNEGSTDTKFRLIEWSIDSEDNARKNFKLTGYEYDPYGVRQNHFENCAYCIEHGREPDDAPNSASIIHSPKQ